MELEKYFEFVANKAIRIAGTRIGIETILRDYEQGACPEEIVLRYPTLSLEQVHATITYYLANQKKVESYSPKLDISSCGNSIEEARNNLKTAVRLFLEEAEKLGTLEELLKEAGYEKADGSHWITPRLVATELMSVAT